jgi:hypothetical protein
VKRKETVREFIDKRSCGAFVTFEFDVDKVSTGYFKEYRCISVEDFLVEYGRRSSYILDDYIVIDTKESAASNDQGQTIWMTLQKKADYVNTLKPLELTAFEVEDILNNLYKVIDLEDDTYNISKSKPYIEHVINLLENKGE